MHIPDETKDNYDMQLYFTNNKDDSAKIKKYIIEIIEKIDNLPKEKKEALGVLLRSKHLQGSWLERFSLFSQRHPFEYFKYYWNGKWKTEDSKVLDDLIRKSFNREKGKKLLKGMLVYLKQDPDLFVLKNRDNINIALSVEDRLVLFERQQIENELDDRASDRERASGNTYFAMRLANSSESTAGLVSSAVSFGLRALDSRSRELREKQNAYSLDKTVSEHEKDQKLFQKLKNNCDGVVKKLIDSTLNSQKYKDLKEEFNQYRLSYEIAEDAIRNCMLDPEILPKVAKLIADSAFAQKKSFSKNSKGLEWEYFAESVKRVMIFSLPILFFSHVGDKTPVVPWQVVPSGVSMFVLNDLLTSEWTDLALEAAQIRALAEDPNYVYF